MTDTLVEPPPPPTVRDDALPRPKVRPVSRRAVIAAAVLSPLIFLGAIFAIVYVFIWRYEPVARAHVPGNANVVVRVEASEIALFRPVRERVGPLLFERAARDDAGSAPAAKAAPSRAQRIKDATGVNIATDIREIVVASVDGVSWVALLGGRIAKGRFVDGMERVLREEGWAGWRREGSILVGPKGQGAAIGQADDGTIALGSDVDVVSASLPATDEWKRMGLPIEGAVTFVATKDAWSGLLRMIPPAAPLPASVRSVERVSGHLSLGSAPALSVRVSPAASDGAGPLAADIERTFAALRILLLLAPDVAGEKGALAAAKVAASGGDVLVTTEWPYEGLDRAVQQIVALAAPRFLKPPSADVPDGARSPAGPAEKRP